MAEVIRIPYVDPNPNWPTKIGTVVPKIEESEQVKSVRCGVDHPVGYCNLCNVSPRGRRISR